MRVAIHNHGQSELYYWDLQRVLSCTLWMIMRLNVSRVRAIATLCIIYADREGRNITGDINRFVLSFYVFQQNPKRRITAQQSRSVLSVKFNI